MKRAKIAELKEKVNCGALLERAGFAVDVKESTRRAVKYRRGGEIVIVTHEGKGWFDPLSDDKGDVFALAQRLDHVGFGEGLEAVAAVVGFLHRRTQFLRPSCRWWMTTYDGPHHGRYQNGS